MMATKGRRITIVGTGMVAPRDLTLGGVDEIRAADVVVYSAPWPGVKSWLSGIGAKRIRDISDLYKENGVDADNYQAILEELITLSSQFLSVVYLVPGNPTLGVTTTSQLLALARSRKIGVSVMPGVSSLDTISVDLEVDYLERGTVAIDSNRLILYRIKLDPTLGLVIYHPASVGTSRVDFAYPWRSNRIELLERYLLETYPPSHPFFIILSASVLGAEPEVISGELDQLSSNVELIKYGSSLYIPPADDFSFDRDFLAVLQRGTGVSESSAA